MNRESRSRATSKTHSLSPMSISICRHTTALPEIRMRWCLAGVAARNDLQKPRKLSQDIGDDISVYNALYKSISSRYSLHLNPAQPWQWQLGKWQGKDPGAMKSGSRADWYQFVLYSAYPRHWHSNLVGIFANSQQHSRMTGVERDDNSTHNTLHALRTLHELAHPILTLSETQREILAARAASPISNEQAIDHEVTVCTDCSVPTSARKHNIYALQTLAPHSCFCS